MVHIIDPFFIKSNPSRFPGSSVASGADSGDGSEGARAGVDNGGNDDGGWDEEGGESEDEQVDDAMVEPPVPPVDIVEDQPTTDNVVGTLPDETLDPAADTLLDEMEATEPVADTLETETVTRESEDTTNANISQD